MADPLPTWVQTSCFPNLVSPDLGLGGWYNRLTYRVLPVLTRAMYGSVVTRWRREALGLPRRPLFADELVRADGRPVPVGLFRVFGVWFRLGQRMPRRVPKRTYQRPSGVSIRRRAERNLPAQR